jgi:TolB-like protein/class 3 adenylate cyclase/tetratricopeptide (TPR) repeat protein
MDIEHISDERRLAAIMFTDMVGFTALSQRDEVTAIKLLDEQRGVVRPSLAKHNGREIHVAGDGFLVEFASSLEAVNCAVEIQSSFRDLNANRPMQERLRVRVGIHLGDVIHRGAEIEGDAVNVASRIEALAPAGGICLTAPVYASVLNKVSLEFETLGVPKLKNVVAPIEIYLVSGFGEERSHHVQLQSTLYHDRVAVLPFLNISPDPADEYFVDGLTEEMISSISQIRGLRVIARTSVMRYKDTKKPIAEIGRELNVGSVLEGSVRKAGDKIRIAVQFVETLNEEPHWSLKFDRDLKDVFAIQSEIAGKVASFMRQDRLGQAPASITGRSTDSIDAYLIYLRGRQFWNKRTQDSLKRAIELFEEALSIDPNYAMAYTGLADCYAVLALLEFMAPRDAFPKAEQAVAQALALNPDLAEAHTSLGLIKFQYGWDWEAAEREFGISIDLNPNYPSAHHFFADYLKAMGRFDEALREIEKARELDPLSLAINTGVGHVLYLSRQYDRAIEEYRRAVELDPDFMATHVWFGRPYLEKGMYAEAISELEIAVKLSGESTLALAMLGHGLASAGRRNEAIQILEKLRERSQSQYVPSYWIAVIYNGFPDREQVIQWLQKAYQERSSWLVWCNVEPRFSWLKDDENFVALTKAINFP